MKIRYYLLLIIAVFFAACGNKSEAPVGEFTHGVFIVNEGNYSESNGSVGFYNETSGNSASDIFEKVNGVATGGVIQSVYFYDDRAFIIDQLASKIHVVDATTFELLTTITDGLSTPRYMVVTNNKAFVSNWGPFDTNYDLPNSYVSVINLDTYQETTSIDTDKGTEGLLVFGGLVYVANSYSNTIDVIDPVLEEVTSQIMVADGPQGFAEDMDGKVWVLSSSYVSGSALSQLDLATEAILKTFPVRSGAKSLTTNGAGDMLYYLAAPYGSDAEVVELPVSATEDAVAALITAANLYGLGVHPQSGMIYLGNHNGFQGNGTILRYEGGMLKDNFAAGVAPNGFVFR